jgi:transposase-like protein
VLVGLAPGGSESTDAWADFLDELTGRGLRPPLLVISDGARQRCLIHRARNLLAKVPTGAQAEVRAAYWEIFDTEELDTPPGSELVRLVQARLDAFADRYRRLYPAAVKCLLSDREQLTSYLRFPVEHHRRIRHSNFIERTFGETRRRVKVIGRLPGEASCLSLVWAVLDRASRGWRGFTMTTEGTRLLHDLRRSLLDPPTQLRPPTSTTPTAADPETVGAVA